MPFSISLHTKNTTNIFKPENSLGSYSCDFATHMDGHLYLTLPETSKYDVGMGLCQYVTFAFMHPPYLVRILFGMPSLHLFTFLMFFYFFIIEVSAVLQQ